MDLNFLFETLVNLLPGLPLTLELAAGAVVLGAMLGLPIALMRISGMRLLASVAWLYVQIIRSVPLLVMLFLIYYGLGQFEAIRMSFLWAFFREPHWCALLALTINTSAYASEIIRGGLQSVPRGELEAARACGMSRFLMFHRIVLPVAIRQALPAYGNEVIAMVKGTSLASLVTLMDVTGIAASIASETYRPVEVFVVAGSIYFGINFILTRIVTMAEYRLTPHLRSRPISPIQSVKETAI